MKKYEFTVEEIQHEGITLKRIRRLNDGKLGGFIQTEENLSHDGGCWVSETARVYGNAKVYGDARISGNAEVKL